MNKLQRDIRRFFYINRHSGGSRQHELSYNGHKIYYNTSTNIHGDKHTVIIDGGRDAGRRPCFQMTMTNKVAVLQSLERGDDCFVDRHDNTRNLVEAAFQLAKSQGCVRFELTDNSYKSCVPHRFNLADVSFLTTGQTWYESILPIKILKRDESEIAELRRRASVLKWVDVYTYLLKFNVDMGFVDFSDVDVSSEGSARVVLNKIKGLRNDISCKFFSENTSRILFIANIPSFYGTSWGFN